MQTVVEDVTVATADATNIVSSPDVDRDGAPYLIYQPAVDLGTGRLLGFEALVRWFDGSDEPILPEDLIPWAEANGHMTALNEWVLAEACAQAARWPSRLQLAVNCSVFQLLRREAAAAAASALAGSGLDPDRLTVEITESSVANEKAVAHLAAMAHLGIQIAVDDVVTDGSVVENRHDSTINTLKIDGSLIADLSTRGGSNRAIIETIITLCHSLHLCTVAEAVETAEQVAILRELGADVAQGYFFSPPLSATAAHALAAMDPLPFFNLTASSHPISLRVLDTGPSRPLGG
jgi:EAL domain-containing protein (putative c-di-GMP-specific phosphodiesterase class I)